MKKITGNVNYDASVDYSQVEEITGSLDCSGADTRAAFPKLTTVGGSLYCRGADTRAAFPRLKKTNAGNALANSRVTNAFKRRHFLFADGILSKIITTKTSNGGVKIHQGVVVGTSKRSYCIEADGIYSHGETIKEARESMLYKIGDRDKSAYDGWTLDRKITKRQAIESYRVITGACEAGVRGFVERHGKLNAKYTIQEVIDITKGQYGNREYAEFFRDQYPVEGE